MNELKNIRLLIKSGFLPQEKRNLKETIFLGLKLYLILTLLKALCFGITLFLDYHNIFDIPKRITLEKLSNYTPLTKVLMIVIIAPIIEEYTYRIGLLFSKRNITITIIGISYFTLKKLSEFDRLYCVLIALGIGISICLILNHKRDDLFFEIWKTNRRKIFYTLLLLFSFLHITDYEITNKLLIYSPIVMLPHFVAGFIYSYARLSSGVILAICIHSFNNGISPLLVIITN